MARRTNFNQSHIIGFIIFLMAVVFATGCAKKLSAPEVEATNPEPPPVENKVADEGIAESVFEEGGFEIDEQKSGASGEFMSEGPMADAESAMEAAPVEEPLMSESADFGAGSAPDFNPADSQSDFSSDTNKMSMEDNAFVAEPFDSAPAEEATAGMADTAESPSDSADNFGSADIGSNNSDIDVPSSFESFASESSSPSTDSSAASASGVEPTADPVAEEARLLSFKPESQMEDIYFDFDQYDLDEKSKSILEKNSEWLRSNPTAKVEIQGHCDERGTNNYNLGLGERRALATKKYLVALGIPEDRLFTISYGEERPFCSQSNDQCYHNNRRAHFMVAE